MRIGMRVVAAVAVAAIAVAGAAGAAKKVTDRFWTSPDYAKSRIGRIALFPVVSYDNSIQNENMVEAALGQSLKTARYRWLSGTSTREMLRAYAGNDSLLKALRAGVVTNARLDSAAAPGLAAMLHCDAILTVRIDQFEQHEPEWNVAGKPYTNVQLTAALVDSLGRLVWRAEGGETGEGPYYDPSANPVSVNDTGLERKPVSAQGGAPSYREVLALLFARWAGQFPAPAAAPDSAAAVPR